MNPHNLIEMANRIGTFFESLPDREEALNGIADHIHRFWEPRMRRALLAALDSGAAHDAGISEIVETSLKRHRDALTPAETA
ncbi:formate dehydrogenase subunit delta [Paraburkholderia caballeronis]|uniref:Formate dehydrogenase delta subunit n=1 Tax=Paraburkholderia caballeronis TaxID=416943 RepID=A0A1H7URR8_9BURK|nr:formate dehydrogenase subunit delta [Paraburkholderia caballeronis]PXW26653.1 formate dehydrogenase delta subunit [Paraburkholderia caballeronis]PXX02199.1 formate dehydrogenase delta subunit [Paraburkholderia caballeronis]RAK01356.1 formate dehydrogenase delta subunit [Paraburkholderia caballeronis]TDV06211.1 formate dehydrogenase delta subunit [Paraburkholderia caballeronis]TDV09713.1 formate dehydrogenase delta subunit [Paraburkholderia caballeronis]